MDQWYLEGFDKVGDLTGFILRHRNEVDWLFYPSKWRPTAPPALLEWLAKLNAS